MRKHKGTYTLENMRPIVAGYESYQGKKLDYCKAHKINRYTFDYWRNKINSLDSLDSLDKNKSRSNKFIAIPSPSATNSTSFTRATKMDSLFNDGACIQLHLPDGKRLELPLSVSEKLLISLLQIRIK